jgi:hypothetical protein
MKRMLLLSTVLMAVLILPGLASATHITEMVAMGDCQGFNAQLDVHFRTDAEYLDLHYEVYVMDGSMEIVMVSGDMHVLNDGDQDVTIMVSDFFNVALDGYFMVVGTFTLTSPYPGGVDEEMASFETAIECGSVDNETHSFENVKAMYR